MPQEPLRASAGRVAKVAAAGLLAAAVIILALLKATPGVYRRTAPIGPDPAAVARFNDHVVNQVGNVLLDKSGGTPLDLEITEEMINARVARFLADEVQAGRPVPPVLKDLRVGFEPGSVVVATRVGRGAAGTIVSQYLHLEPAPEGRLIVRPVGTGVGMVPLPGGVLDYARRAVALAIDLRQAEGDDEEALGLWRAILDGLDGKPVPLGKGRRSIQLESIQVERGVLKIQGRRGNAPRAPHATDAPAKAGD